MRRISKVSSALATGVSISEGRVLAQGTPEVIVENPDVRRVYLGEHFRM